MEKDYIIAKGKEKKTNRINKEMRFKPAWDINSCDPRDRE